MEDHQLHRFFVEVIQMKEAAILTETRAFSEVELTYLMTLWQAYKQKDKTTKDEADSKGYTVEDGATLSFDQFVEIASKTAYCPISKVKVLFDMSDFNNQPFVFSLNRIKGFDGPRTKPTHKYLHSIENVEGCCRTVNLAQNCLGTEEVQKWIQHIQASPIARFLH